MAGVWAADPHAAQSKRLPFRIKGTVVHGYARGGKELGFPTGMLNY
jgi:FAD synthase